MKNCVEGMRVISRIPYLRAIGPKRATVIDGSKIMMKTKYPIEENTLICRIRFICGENIIFIQKERSEIQLLVQLLLVLLVHLD
jgi:hypothetical protein